MMLSVNNMPINSNKSHIHFIQFLNTRMRKQTHKPFLKSTSHKRHCLLKTSVWILYLLCAVGYFWILFTHLQYLQYFNTASSVILVGNKHKPQLTEQLRSAVRLQSEPLSSRYCFLQCFPGVESVCQQIYPVTYMS